MTEQPEIEPCVQYITTANPRQKLLRQGNHWPTSAIRFHNLCSLTAQLSKLPAQQGQEQTHFLDAQ